MMTRIGRRHRGATAEFVELRGLAAVALWASIGWCTGCAGPATSNERPLPEKPVVLIIGDSISMGGGYFPGLVEKLGDDYQVVHNPGNGSDSANVLTHLDEWVSDTAPDIIQFNCGLHDIKLDRKTGKHQQPIDAYEANLREIVRRLKTQSHARLVFALTTPVNEEWHHARKPFDRREQDVQQYNAVARKVMTEAGVPFNDLHAVITSAGPDTCLKPDGVHMNKRGNNLLAEAVATGIELTAGREASRTGP